MKKKFFAMILFPMVLVLLGCGTARIDTTSEPTTVINVAPEATMETSRFQVQPDDTLTKEPATTNSVDQLPRIGQVVTVKEGTTYWETSLGTGRNNMVTANNNYVPQDRVVTLNAVSYLYENGEIESSFYRTFEKLQQKNPNVKIENWKRFMVHICTESTDLGWVYPENLNWYNETSKPDPEEQPVQEITPEQFAEEIQAKEGSTVIYVDQSGSMNSFVEQATRAFDTIDKKEAKIIIFAEKEKLISKEEINEYHWEIGGGTNIYGALNTALQYAPKPKHIVIISDLYDNQGETLVDIPELETVEILCPDVNYPPEELKYIKDTWENANVQLAIIK